MGVYILFGKQLGGMKDESICMGHDDAKKALVRV